jgi:hypothetical protein
LDNRIVSLDEVLEGRKEAMNNILGDKETEKPIPSTRAVPTKEESKPRATKRWNPATGRLELINAR